MNVIVMMVVRMEVIVAVVMIMVMVMVMMTFVLAALDRGLALPAPAYRAHHSTSSSLTRSSSPPITCN